MEIDFKGRIKNVDLPYSKSLLPLFEAVVNSIHAIQETSITDGIVEILIERDDSEPLLDPKDYEFQPIKNFVVTDNGIGFNEKNYNAFLTADTTIKAAQGAKGIGRFFWLKAFKNVEIDSIFNESTKFYKRKFNFLVSENGIEDHELTETQENRNITVVKLLDFHEKYKLACPRKTETIALRIIEHALVYFLSENCPKVFLRDKTEKFELNKLFEERIKALSDTNIFNIKSSDFQITHLKLYACEESKHQIHYCADFREVMHENLSIYIPDLSKRIKDEENNTFTYMAYVSGKYLNEKVNSERTNFNFVDDSNGLFQDEITKKELTTEIIKNAKQNLKSYLEKIKEEKLKQVENFIKKEAPQYKPVLKYQEEYLDQIRPDLPDDRLDIELYKITSNIELKLKEKSKEILKTDITDVRDLESYKEEYRKFIEEINEIGKSKLAKYIIHRKLILELLSKTLEFNIEENKYNLEENIHEIIFPLRTTSEDIDYEKQNLWIIDEKLAYHNYLASDKPLSKLEPITISESDRPDIIIFNSPFAFVEDSPPFSSIVIIEFKRPVRKDYSEDSENPISQIYSYVRKIQDGIVLDKNGRPITIKENTPFYSYIICDLTNKIKEISENYGLITTPDEMGYFGYNKNLSTYIEIISFDKLLNDAKKRNQILFDKLNLPR